MELEKLSSHPGWLVVADYSYRGLPQNAYRNLSKEGLKVNLDTVLTEDINNVQVAPTIVIVKGTEDVNCAMTKVSHVLHLDEVFKKSEKNKPFINITSTLLVRLNLLFHINSFNLKQYFPVSICFHVSI